DVVEEIAHRARGAQVAAVLAERPAQVRARAVVVVRDALDQHRRATGAVALVADRLLARGSPTTRRPPPDRPSPPRSGAGRPGGMPRDMRDVRPFGVAGHK